MHTTHISLAQQQQTVTVSRATLFPRGSQFVADDDKLTELDNLIRSNLGGLEATDTRKRKRNSSVEGQSALHAALESARESGLPSLYN